MNFIAEIRQLLKNKVVIRHRKPDESDGAKASCCICSRKIKMLSGNLCVAIGDDGLLCPVCIKLYAPEMATAVREQLPESVEDSGVDNNESPAAGLSVSDWIDIAREITMLESVSLELAKGIARGIVEAPAGHIGLLHYAKNIHKPVKKESESEKDFKLRVRTYRMTKLNEILTAETAGRLNKIKAALIKLGLPSNLL